MEETIIDYVINLPGKRGAVPKTWQQNIQRWKRSLSEQYVSKNKS